MRTDRLNKHIWLIDTIASHDGISRAEINRLWRNSVHGDGNDIPHRTFFNYRRDIEHLFDIDIQCRNGRYYIDSATSLSSQAFRSWMLDTFSIRGAMADAPDIANRIVMENIPSSRTHLTTILTAIHRQCAVSITYAGFDKSKPEQDIILYPQFVKLFRQRWYVIGVKAASDQVRTYSLDRIVDVHLTGKSFRFDPDIDPDTFFDECFGITYSQAPPQRITLRVEKTSAKYLRALPLHKSQAEEVHSDYSIFHFNMKITPDLVREILSIGQSVTVISPPGLRTAVTQQLIDTLSNYNISCEKRS